MSAGDFAAVAVTLYAAHHVGDYWVQTHHQALHKGRAGREGQRACLLHVLSYVATQVAFLFVLVLTVNPKSASLPGICAALAVSGVTHYLADRQEHGVMLWLVRKMPWKAGFLALGVPRELHIFAGKPDGTPRGPDPLDNPQLATGAWALDQSWHIFWGVFVAAILAVTL